MLDKGAVMMIKIMLSLIVVELIWKANHEKILGRLVECR